MIHLRVECRLPLEWLPAEGVETRHWRYCKGSEGNLNYSRADSLLPKLKASPSRGISSLLVEPIASLFTPLPLGDQGGGEGIIKLAPLHACFILSVIDFLHGCHGWTIDKSWNIGKK
jgi:hypothetical protein